MSRRRRARPPAGPSPPEASPVASSESPSDPRVWLGRLGLAALLCGAVLLGYLPALHGGFIWDDSVLLTDNAMIRAPDGLYRFWFTAEAFDYWPLTSTTFWVEWRLWGMNPTGYHVTNLALHAIEALLLWGVLLKLRIGGAYLAALVFAVHPVNVESVAWIAQRKNLVGMLFFLLAIRFYLEADGEVERKERRLGLAGASRWYWLSLAMFLLALLGKGSVSTLPVILLLLAWWQRRRVTARDLARVAPFAAIAAALVLVNIWFQTHGGTGPIRTASLVERLLGAGAVVWFYLSKALFPVHLAFVYPQWHIEVGNPLWWIPLLTALGVSVALVRICGTWGRPFLMAWAFFCVALLPVMGLTDVYFMTYSLVADHYQHIAIIGVIALAAAGWSEWQRRAQGSSRTAAVAVAATVVGTLAWLTVRQSATYRDEETLYRATIEANPDCWLAHYNLAVALKAQGRRRDELLHLKEAVRARPDYAQAHNNLAIALMEEGRSSEALSHAEQALRIKPDMPMALVNLGILLSKSGRPSEALGALERAVQLLPDSAEAHSNLGLTLAVLGRLEEAMAHYHEASRLEPDSPEHHNALGNTLVAAGRYEEAISEFEQALRLKPDHAAAQATLAQVFIRSGRPQDAIARYEEALRLSPDGTRAPESHYNLGVLLTASGRRQEGFAHYARALELKPSYAEAHYNMAVALLAEGRSTEAILHFEEAVRSKPDLLVARISLAETCARTGRLSEAVAHAQEALGMAPPDTRAGLERKIRAWQAQRGRLPPALSSWPPPRR
jgi:tetratricopeptide (TPR) repeat protein